VCARGLTILGELSEREKEKGGGKKEGGGPVRLGFSKRGERGEKSALGRRASPLLSFLPLLLPGGGEEEGEEIYVAHLLSPQPSPIFLNKKRKM